MNKDNIFRSSEFHMDKGDVLHLLIKDETGALVRMDLVGLEDADVAEDSNIPIELITTMAGLFSIDLEGTDTVSFYWGDGSAKEDVALAGMGRVTVTHVFAAGGTIYIENGSCLTYISADGQDLTSAGLLKGCTAIEYIYFPNNSLTEFTTYGEWVNLKELVLYNNNLTVVETHPEWTQLRVLYLTDNNLAEIETHPEWVSIGFISINNNSLTEFIAHPEWINLWHLSLEFNNISEFTTHPEWVLLEDIHLTNNPISSFDTYEEWVDLEHLYVGQTNITSLDSYEAWTKLLIVEANSTGVSSFDTYDTWVLLEVVNFAGADLTTFEAHREWVALTSFNLFDNAITSDIDINNILVEFDNSGITVANIDLSGGTNAIPTGDGLVAKASLILKGNTVTTN